MSDDLIRRANAIEAIEEMPSVYDGWSNAYEKPFIIGTLEEVPSAEPKRGEWIPCEERLPKDEGVFLVTRETYVFNEYSYPVGTLFYSPSFGWVNASHNKVLAWMPLPGSYQATVSISEQVERSE